MGAQRGSILGDMLVDDFVHGGGADEGKPTLSSPLFKVANPEVVMQTIAMQLARRYVNVPEVLAKPEWGNVQASYNQFLQAFKTHNQADLLQPQPGETDEQAIERAWQLEPVRVDPTVISNLRQQIYKIDREMQQKAGVSIFNLPQTSRIARVLTNDASPQTPGYIQADTDITKMMPWYQRALLPIGEAAETAGDIAVQGAWNIGNGIGLPSLFEKLGLISLDGLTDGNALAHYNPATSWIQDQDGSWYHNGGKVGSAEMVGGLWHMVTGHLIDQELARAEDTRQEVKLRSAGIDHLGMQLGTTLGSLLPMTAAGVLGRAGGNMALRGLRALAGGEGVAASRAVQIVSELAGGGGGFGAYEAATRGHIEGYGAAFMQGVATYPVMALIGAGGRSLEGWLSRTAKLPDSLARTLSGAAEGLGFVGVDPNTWSAAWDFVKNPSPKTRAALFETGMVNAIAMAVFKGLGGTPPGETQGVKSATSEEVARGAAATGADAAAALR